MDIYHSESLGGYFTVDENGEMQPVPAHIAETTNTQAMLAQTGENYARAANRLTSFLDEPAYEDQLATSGGAMEELRENFPWMSAAGNVLGAAPLAVMGGSLPLQTMYGAVEGALTQQDPVKGGIEGAAGTILGDLAGRVLGKAMNAVRGLRTPQEPGPMARQFAETGGHLTPGQRTGDKTGDIIEARIQSDPYSADFMNEIGDMNQENVNQLALEALDIEGVTDLTQEGIMLADQQLSRQFREVGQNLDPMTMNSNYLQDIKEVAPKIRHIRDPELQRALSSLGEEGGAMYEDLPGSTWMKLRTELTDVTNTSDSSALTNRAGDLINQLDDMVLNNRPDQAVEYLRTRKQFELLATMKGGNTVKDGNVNPRLLANKLKQHYGASYAPKMEEINPRMGPLARNVQAGTSTEMTPQFGRSGTAERSGAAGLLSSIVKRPAYSAYMSRGDNVLGFLQGMKQNSMGGTPAEQAAKERARRLLMTIGRGGMQDTDSL